MFLCDIAVYNLGQNICRLFLLFLEQFLFTISETEPDYYHQKASERVASQATERLKTLDLRKLGNFQKIPTMLGFDSKYPAGHPKTKFWRFSVKSCKKHSIVKPILLNFVNLPTTFCPKF